MSSFFVSLLGVVQKRLANPSESDPLSTPHNFYNTRYSGRISLLTQDIVILRSRVSDLNSREEVGPIYGILLFPTNLVDYSPLQILVCVMLVLL